ncbi:MAG: hypothetical protein Q7R81_06245 [Candidatus Peregrinibacteria bacterium]|nr:hypothetical protein [Candidatus Peregrinibacteria bacterium]
MQKHSLRTFLSVARITLMVFVFGVSGATASVFRGDGLEAGKNFARSIPGISKTDDPRMAAQNVLIAIMDYLALAGVIAIIVAGFYLILGMGSDTSRDKAKTIIIYVIVGLLIVLFARVIVTFVTQYIASQV